jgi:hypothetical protein
MNQDQLPTRRTDQELSTQVSTYLSTSWMTSYRTASEIILSDQSHSIGVLAKLAPADTIRFLASKMRDAVNFWAVGRSTFDSEDGRARIVELIRLIVQEYSWLKPADIRMVFQNAKLGKYGEAYNRMDGPMILGWFKKYAEERIALAEELHIRKHRNVQKPVEEDTRTPEQRKEDMLKLAAMIGSMAKTPQHEEVMTKEPYTPPRSLGYQSVEHYCEEKGIDTDRYLQEWEERNMTDFRILAEEMGMEYEEVYRIKKDHLLRQLNHEC